MKVKQQIQELKTFIGTFDSSVGAWGLEQLKKRIAILDETSKDVEMSDDEEEDADAKEFGDKLNPKSENKEKKDVNPTLLALRKKKNESGLNAGEESQLAALEAADDGKTGENAPLVTAGSGVAKVDETKL